jgi:hypothetical protein
MHSGPHPKSASWNGWPPRWVARVSAAENLLVLGCLWPYYYVTEIVIFKATLILGYFLGPPNPHASTWSYPPPSSFHTTGLRALPVLSHRCFWHTSMAFLCLLNTYSVFDTPPKHSLLGEPCQVRLFLLSEPSLKFSNFCLHLLHGTLLIDHRLMAHTRLLFS